MHSKDARAHGEQEQRLYALPVWREGPFFSERERAALAWTEAVTRLVGEAVPDDLDHGAGGEDQAIARSRSRQRADTAAAAVPWTHAGTLARSGTRRVRRVRLASRPKVL
jgi:hypothetical protein